MVLGMKLEEFLQKAMPYRKSKLGDFMKEILELHRKGYNSVQIQEWLSSEGINVTDRAISKRIKKEKLRLEKDTPNKDIVKVSQPHHPIPTNTLNGFNSGLIKSKEERETFANQFISENPISPALKRIISSKDKL
jgi:hypothetical protein